MGAPRFLGPIALWKGSAEQKITQSASAGPPESAGPAGYTAFAMGLIRHCEIKITQPRGPTNQQVTFSSYKNCNTVGTVSFISYQSPTGTVSFISELYGGNISDKEITKRSGILDLMERGDEIMADQGFLIEDLVRPHGNSGIARVDQLPGHQVALYKLNMEICRHDIYFGGLAYTLVQIFKVMNIFARARPSIARVGPGLATPLHGTVLP